MASTTVPRVDGQRMTIEEYLAGPPDEFKAELIYGVYHVCPSPTRSHQKAAHYLSHLLRTWTQAFGLGEVSHDLDMVLDDIKNLAYRPDIIFVSKENENRWMRDRLFGAADLAVEILSPSDKPSVRGRKYADYERYGVAWYWVIDPPTGTLEEIQLVNDSFVSRSLVAGDAVFEPGLFPGLQFRLPPLFQGDLKAAVLGQAATLL